MITKQQLGEALVRLTSDVETETLQLVEQYRERGDQSPAAIALVKHALDTPHRARAQIQGWMQRADASRGAGTAAGWMQQALAAVGSARTFSQINADLAALEALMQPIADDLLSGNPPTWDTVADRIEAALAGSLVDEALDYRRLPIANDYRTILNERF